MQRTSFSGTVRHRAAFTLVELLVVVTIIGLLVAILMPSLSAARSLTRAAVCRHNLRQLSTAFAASARQTSAARYPVAGRWPGVPYGTAQSDGIFLCPEDDNYQWNLEDGMTYHSAPIGGTRHIMKFADCDGCRVTRGPQAGDIPLAADETGYTFEEWPWMVPGWKSNGTWPNYGRGAEDGVFVVSPAGKNAVKVKLARYSCGVDNRAYLFDQGLFGVDDWLGNHVGQEIVLASAYTSYGINPEVGRRIVPPRTLVLVEWDSSAGARVADPARDDVETILNASTRHRGKLNFLRDDGSVTLTGATSIYPSIEMGLWVP